MTQPVTKCIFCGGSPVTNEHMFPRWSHQYDKKKKGKFTRMYGMGNLTHSDFVKGKGRGDIHDWQVKCVCEKKCNNGWMRRLENEAKPIIIRLMHGEAFRLNPDEQIIVAAWCALKAMISEYDDHGHVTTHHTQRKRMMRLQRPPDIGWKIWVGHYERKHWPTQWASNPFTFFGAGKRQGVLGDPVTYFNSQVSTQVIQQLFIQVLRTPMQSFIEKWRFTAPQSGMLRPIWPPSGFSIVWPPPTMSDRDADYITGAILTTLDARARRALGLIPKS